MNTRSSSWTGRAHRSIESAFGPYSNELAPLREKYDRMPVPDAIVIAISAVGGLALFAMICFGIVK